VISNHLGISLALPIKTILNANTTPNNHLPHSQPLFQAIFPRSQADRDKFFGQIAKTGNESQTFSIKLHKLFVICERLCGTELG